MQGLLAAIALLLTLCPTPALGQASRPVSVYAAYQITQEDEHDELIVDAAETWGLDPFLFKALLWEESGVCRKRINPDSGAAGCGQFTRTGIKGLNTIRCLRLHKRTTCDLGDEEFTREKALDPEEAIPAAAELLSWLIDRWGWSAVAHYNGNKWKWAFSKRVFRTADRYRTMAGLPPLRRLKPPLMRLPLPTS
jgi:hypothetical protein